MIKKPQPQEVPALPEIESRQGARAAITQIWAYLKHFFEADYRFKSDVYQELTPLYGELNLTPGSVGSGGQETGTITVEGAIPGYSVEVTYDKDLQGFQISGYVSAPNTVTVVVHNGASGPPITLTPGRVRVWVWPRLLTT